MAVVMSLRMHDDYVAVAVCSDHDRRFLKQRYDSRANMADWDYSMHLVPKAPLVNLREYVRWRYA
jgi:hypothetical protein